MSGSNQQSCSYINVVIHWTDCSIKVGVPNACANTELSLLYHLCQRLHNPCVVELGPMFGGSTIAMLSGLQGKGIVHSFDHFKYAQWMEKPQKRFGTDYGLNNGDSFYNIFLENVKNYSNVKSYEVDLLNLQTWSEPIDLLVVDALKCQAISLRQVPLFFPQVKVGGLIFDQDILFGDDYNVMYAFYYMMRDCIVPHTVAHPGTGVLFEVKAPITVDIERWLSQDKKATDDYIANLKDSNK